jgi:hypothetical protein
MSTRPVLIAVLAALLAAAAASQAPGDFPHLQLSDGASKLVPPASGPFNNSNVFQAFSGQAFEARLSYGSAGQPNTNVLWALLVSAGKTPLPTNVTPPGLLTMPPLILLLPSPPNLDINGSGALHLFVPAGILDAKTYVQGLIYDSTSVPTMRLSNGLTVDVDVPAFSVDFSWVRATPATDDETLVRDFGRITLGPDVLPELKPVGTQAPPEAVPDTPFYADDARFLPIVPNEPDGPVNPRSRPFTRIAAAATGDDTTIVVTDTSFFPMRGRLQIAMGGSNLWGDKVSAGTYPPRGEIVHYDGKLPDRFLNCKRAQLGTSGASPSTTTFPHVLGEMVLGDFTMATTGGARSRSRLALDADSEDMPHVVIPPYTFTDEEGGATSVDLDLYLFETKVDLAQGFVLFDRVTRTWRVIGESLKNTLQGRWNPMIAMAPDGRSFLAELRVPNGVELGWDYKPAVLILLRTDGLDWPASGTEAWQVPYEIVPDPTVSGTHVRSRRAIMLASAIVGPDPDNYVAFVGLADKWKRNLIPPGLNFEKNVGAEAEWARDEVLVRDYIEIPMVPPGSTKSLPSMPRPYITSQFGTTGFGAAIIRFDPEVLASPDRSRLLLTGGGSNNADDEEDAFVIRNLAITQAGGVSKVLGNVTGYSANGLNPGETALRPFHAGGHGWGQKAAFSPDGTRVALVAKQNAKTRDWIDIVQANGGTYGTVKHVYGSGGTTWLPGGVYGNDRVVCGLRWADNERLLFVMGKNPYDDPLANSSANTAKMDLFVYDVQDDLMTNLTRTGGVDNDFGALGTIIPAGFLASDNGDFAYFLRAGGISNVGGSSLPVGTQVLNLVGVNLNTLDVFPVTGTEFGDSALVPDLFLPATELTAPIESPAALRPIEGGGVQDSLLWFTAHLQGGNQSDELFATNLESPFVTFRATFTADAGLHLRDVTPDPFGGKVAFARTDGTSAMAATQHPYVVDLDAFLFERDLLPNWASGGTNIGRVMGGSFHFLPPSGTAGEALVFAFGLSALPTGVALQATPAYYPLAAVSDVLAEPVPVVIGLIDTFLLGTDYRFYLPFATTVDG